MNLKKNIFVGVFAVLFAMTMVSCSKGYQKATIDRDCTGTYIQLNDKDYFVCNPEMVSSYDEGSEIKVKFNSKSTCPQDPNQNICEMYHMNYGIVEITEIK